MRKIKEFVLREIAGESILVPVGKTTLKFNGMITLSETAAFIWKHLEEAASQEELIGMLREEYEVDEETAETDVRELLKQMIEADMIECSDAASGW